MISDVLTPALRKRFADRNYAIDEAPNPIARFAAAHPEVGDVCIWDDGDEATVGIGEITHGHFNPYDPSLSPEQIAAVVTEEVLRFLDDLFRDRVLLWKTREGGSGGWRVLDEEAKLSLMDGDDLTY